MAYREDSASPNVDKDNHHNIVYATESDYQMADSPNTITVKAQESSSDRPPIEYVLDSIPLTQSSPFSSYSYGHQSKYMQEEFQNRRMYQLEGDLRILKVSICNVLNVFCNLPNTTVPRDLKESIEKGTISSMVLFLGRLVERLENYRLQEANFEEMKDLMEDTSNMNCTLITEKDMMQDEILSIIETTDTYEEMKNKLVTMLNRGERLSEQNRVRKRRRLSVNTCIPNQKKPKRVRSSQLRSRHPMYEISSRARMEAFAYARPVTQTQTTPYNDPDVIEVSSKDGESDDNSQEEKSTEDGNMGIKRKLSETQTTTSDNLVSSSRGGLKRGRYYHYEKNTKLAIAKFASDFGASNAAKHFTQMLGRKVNESTVRNMMQKYYQGILKDDEIEQEIIRNQTGTSTSTRKSTKTKRDDSQQATDDHSNTVLADDKVKIEDENS